MLPESSLLKLANVGRVVVGGGVFKTPHAMNFLFGPFVLFLRVANTFYTQIHEPVTTESWAV